MGIKIWLDDRWEPGNSSEFTRCYSVDEAKQLIVKCENNNTPIDLISLDYDLGDYSFQGGSGMALLTWLLERNTLYPASIHSTHKTGRSIMEDFIRENWPKNN